MNQGEIPIRSLKLLLVEDNDAHAKIVTRSLEKAQVRNELTRVSDGVEAVRYFLDIEAQESADFPDLVLLDLNLPKKNGFEVLEEIKTNPVLKQIPVIVLTTSDAESDRAKAYRLHANSYLLKPLESDLFREMIKDLCKYWGAWNQPADIEAQV